MYNGIGLQTPRGSGTNGYIQSNKFFVRAKTNKVVMVTGDMDGDSPGTAIGGVSKGPNKDILEHDRKRQIELKLVVLEDKLLEQGFTDAEIAEKLEEARRTLEAADASVDAGPTVFSDKKVSDTQSHQIAARKEKQMETLKAALRIGLDDQKKSKEGVKEFNDDDKLQNSQKSAGNDNGNRYRKHSGDGKDDGEQEKGGGYRPEELKGNKNYDSKKKGGSDLSDSDSDERNNSRKLVKGSKKHLKASSDSDYGSDIDVQESGRRKASRTHKKSRTRYTDDSDSDYGVKQKKGRKRHDSDDVEEFSSDEGPKVKSQKVKKLLKKNQRHDTESDSTTHSEKEELNNSLDRKKSQVMSRRPEKVDSILKEHKKYSHQGKGRSKHKYDINSDSGSDRSMKHGKLKTERRRRHDSDEDESDADKRKANHGSRRGRSISDRESSDDSESYSDSSEQSSASDSSSEGSDYSAEVRKMPKVLKKYQSHHGSGQRKNGKDSNGNDSGDDGLDTLGKLEKLYHTRVDAVDGSGSAGHNKSKLEAEKQDMQPVSKSGPKNGSTRHGSEVQKEMGIEPETNIRSYKDEYKRGSHARSDCSRPGHGRESVERRGRYESSRDVHHGSRRSDRNEKEQRESGRHTREEEDNRRRKHGRDDEEEESYRRHEKYVGHLHGRHEREYEEERESRRHDSSKRARYDDSHSGGNRYDSDRHGDVRSRH